MEPQTPIVPADSPDSSQIPDSDPKIPTDNHWITILSMAVFVLLSLAAVAFLYYQNQQLKTMLANYQVTPSATPDVTANWRQITSKYWSLKAPTDLHYILCEPVEDSIMFDPSIKSDQKIECNFDGIRLISISRTTSPYSIPTNPPTIPTPEPNSPAGNLSVVYVDVLNKGNISIDGKTAIYQTEIQHGGQGEGTYIRAYVIDGSTTYVFTLSNVSQKDLLDQILSTFQFTQ